MWADLPSLRERLEVLCERNHASACVKLGDGTYFGIEPLEVFEQACRLGSARGCDRFFNTASRTCEEETFADARQCQNVGLAHQRGWGTPQDQELAREFFQRACNDTSDRYACLQLEDGVPMPPPHATDPTLPAWKQVSDWAWASVGSRFIFREVLSNTTIEDVLEAAQNNDPEAMVVMGMARDFGWEGPEDAYAAHYFYRQACEFGQIRGCSNLAYFELNGRGTTPVTSRGLERYEEVCLDGGGLACNALGTYALENDLISDGQTTPEDTAYSLYLRACTLGNGGGCDNIGDMLWSGRGAVEANRVTAIAAYRDGCNFLNPSACFQLAEIGSRDTMGALSIDPESHYQRACELGHERSCEILEQ